MPKATLPLLALLAALAAPAAAPAQPGAGGCGAGTPSVQVRVVGFKRATGTIKVAVYGQRGFLTKEGTLHKVKLPVRSAGPMDICLPVPAPGVYAVAVHHDLNGNRDKDRADGGGYSRNPHLSITSLRPRFSAAAFQVGSGPRVIPVQLQYLQGLKIAPVNS